MILSGFLLATQAVSATIRPPIPPAVESSGVLRPPIADALKQVIRPPEPAYPVQRVVSPDDYPAGAKGKGIVGMNLFVDKQGHAVDCEIRQSGGSPLLNSRTCDLVKRRARFTPAVDRDGNPSIGRISVQVDWAAVFRNTRIVRIR